MLMEFDYRQVIRHHYGDKQKARLAMVDSLMFYYPVRANFICRSRIKSIILIIRMIDESLDGINYGKL